VSFRRLVVETVLLVLVLVVLLFWLPNLIACGVSNFGIWMGGTVVEELEELRICVFHGGFLRID
jgi:hypothetical protein